MLKTDRYVWLCPSVHTPLVASYIEHQIQRLPAVLSLFTGRYRVSLRSDDVLPSSIRRKRFASRQADRGFNSGSNRSGLVARQLLRDYPVSVLVARRNRR